MRQIAVRVDDDLHAAIEAARGEIPRERWMRAALTAAASGASPMPPKPPTGRVMALDGDRVVVSAPIQRGSPSPSLARFAGGVPKKGGKR